MGKLEPGSVPGSPRRKRDIPEYHARPQPCDAGCGRTALHYATHYGIVRTLVFCTFHFMKHKDALIAKGWHTGDHK